MSATLELKYFNTFWLKQIRSLSNMEQNGYPIKPVFNNPNAGTVENIPVDFTVTTTATVDVTTFAGQIVLTTTPNPPLQVGMTATGANITGTMYVSLINTAYTDTRITLSGTGTQALVTGDTVTFTASGTVVENDADDWFIEESRIRGGYNNTSVDLGVKAYLVEDEPAQQHRFASLIYSGIFNSRTGVNNTNQFSVSESITKSLDPINRSIQRLYAEDTNLIIFQETKVSRSLIDKDAIYSAEGSAAITSTPLVIGQNISYAGEFGISTNPESFAVYGFRKYFVDRERNAVLRLSQDGITEISNYGMMNYFRDKLSVVDGSGKIQGAWDMHNKQYVVSIQQSPQNSKGFTLSFDEPYLGWTSFFDFTPDSMISLDSNFYSFFEGKIYQHYTLQPNSTKRAVFYEVEHNSDVSFVFNDKASVIKNFNTVNYEGSNNWSMASFDTSTDSAASVGVTIQATSLEDLETLFLQNTFKKKENKYFANIINTTSSLQGEVIWGGSMTGVKGFFAKVKMSTDNSDKRELYAVSTNYVESSY
tara:strand:- start:1170 stop:2774 length:1605 start_codon:yes stop_codon:yes gene_type:complete